MASPRLLPKLAAVTLTAATLTAGTAHADPDKVAYELAERCGRSAQTLFPTLKDAGNGWSFENHYNPKENSCYMLIEGTSFDKVKKTGFRQWELWNVNENRQIDMLGCGFGFAAINDKNAVDHACATGDLARIDGSFARSVFVFMER
jgi:hypothetical protein